MLALALSAVLAAAPSPHAALWAMFAEQWDWQEAAYPEQATENGDDRFDDRLTDWSPAAIAARQAHEREMLARAEAFDPEGLDAEDRLDLELFRYPLRQEIEGFRFHDEYLQLNQIDSPPGNLAELARAVPRRRVADYENCLTRMRAIPAYIDQILALLRRGLAAGITPPRVVLERAPAQLENHVGADPEENPLYEAVFATLPATIDPAQQRRLRAEAIAVLRERVLPAYRELLAFVRDTYVPNARTTLGFTALPDGAAWYRHEIEVQTTTEKTPAEIHALGLAEVARLDAAMERARRDAGFPGDQRAFFHFLATDPRFFYRDAAALLTGYRDIAKRIDAGLPRLFGTLPRLTYGVSAMPAYEAKTAPAAFYEPGSPEAGRSGTFLANSYDLASRPKWAMVDLTLHEAVPGHHLQIALAQELTGLPKFRRFAMYNAFLEGWALYCESLGGELGVLESPYDRFGQLSAEMWRAVRLVVDTGLHAMGWTREEAVRYFIDHTGQPELNARVEVDRYLVWPGQALGYKLGQLEIRALREQAEKALGPRFDERAFHDEVIGAGALPLPILKARVERWIAGQAGGPQR